MTSSKSNGFERRDILRAISIAAGAATFSPKLTAADSLRIASSEAPLESQTTGQTVRLAEYATNLRYDEIPAEILQRAKDCFADTVAAILFGAPFPWSRMIIEQARLLGNGGKSAVLSTGANVSAPAAALAHGAMCHAFEQDNITFPDSGAHPGAALETKTVAMNTPLISVKYLNSVG